ncbi:MAG: four helix bundle protein [Flavobacteriales bacterium]
MEERKFDFEDRLVAFAADCTLFCEELMGTFSGKYYGQQLLRSSGASALNYGEVQGTNTRADFINKASLCLKELRESRVNLKILMRLDKGDNSVRGKLLSECEELIAIVATMIKNKK